ncbi:AI-2E family transporter [Pseudactinotalea sp. Z1732]|uniref:AI-2E family transporter n=1 Tax=Micrococcales TaxID=85006 RepID=UPI003C7DC032
MARGAGKRFIDRFTSDGGRDDDDRSAASPASADPASDPEAEPEQISARARAEADENLTAPEGTPQRLGDAATAQASSRVVSASAYVTPAVRGAAAWAWRLAIIAIVGGALVWALMQLSLVVIPVLVAVLLAALMMPVVRWLSGRGVPRTLAVALTMLVSFGAVGTLLTLAGRAVGSGIADLADQAVQGLYAFVDWLSEGPLNISPDQLEEYLDEALEQVQDNVQEIVTGAISVTTTVGQIFAGMLIALFCLFFFLRDGRTIWTWVVGLLPQAGRAQIDGAALRGWLSLGQYSRMQILVAFIDGVGIGVGAWILGVPLALPLGVLVFLGSFIPIVGAVLTGAIAVLVALVDGGFWTSVIMLAIVLGVQQIEGNVLQPFLMGRALKLHPVAVLLAVTAGTVLGGIIGALLAVPIIAATNSVMLYLHGHDNAPAEDQRDLERATLQMQRDFRQRGKVRTS